MDESRQAEAPQLLDTLRDAKTLQIRAWRETDPENYGKTVFDDYQARCAIWADLRSSMIAAMRAGPLPE